MKNIKKKLLSVLAFTFIILVESTAFASGIEEALIPVEYTEEFQEYLELTDEEKSKEIQPRSYVILKTNTSTRNVFRMLRASSSQGTSYTLKDYIPNNVKIKNQEKTNMCWTFAALSSLETNLAMQDYKKGITSNVYDFSEAHMEYATARNFTNDNINEAGFDREVDSGGTYYMATAYLTNGQGAIDEEAMPFEEYNTAKKIDISELQKENRLKVTSEVYDTVEFPSYGADDDKTEIIQLIKEHIKNYGSVAASIHGASLFSDYYNNETGAIYCDDEDACKPNHGVSIIGWDDSYDISNFNEKHVPTSNGAWIIRNSWGETITVTLDEMKQDVYEAYKGTEYDNSWTSYEDVDASFAKRVYELLGFTIDGDTAIYYVGDEGFMYISYEDVNVYSGLFGISKSANEIDYDNIYQYNEYGVSNVQGLKASKLYLANVFSKKTSGTEYLTQVSIHAPEDYTCKVYVNPNGTSKATADLTLVELEAGDTESFSAGYHMLEFKNPIKINANEFVVVIEIQGNRDDSVYYSVEENIQDSSYDVVEIEQEKCFLTYSNYFDENEWLDLSTLHSKNSELGNSDSTIKAFTVTNIAYEPPVENPSDNEDEGNDNVTDGNNNKANNLENSNFDNAKCVVKVLKSYLYSDDASKDYSEIELEINGIERNVNTNEYEYYYYLSTSKTENNITDWVKIKEAQTSSNKLTFTINTNDITNISDLTDAENVYLYIKEVAKSNNSQKTLITSPILMNVSSETQVIVKSANVNTANSGEKVDNTTMSGTLPKTGQRIFIIFLIVFCVIIMFVFAKKAKKYNEKK